MSDRVPETIGELGVILVRVERQLEQLVTKSTFEAEQQRTREEFRAVREDMTEWRAESRAAHDVLETKIGANRDALNTKIDLQRDRAEALENDARKTKSSRTFQAVLTAAGWLVALGTGVFLALMGR